MDDSEIKTRNDFRPGDMGRIIWLHGTLYAAEYGFDHTFEPYVAGPLSEFARNRTDRDRIWIVEKNGEIMGSAAAVRFSETEAQLRWLLLHPEVRGTGLGAKLADEVIAFCRSMKYRSIFLLTVSQLVAAGRIYRSRGFRLADSKTQKLWGQTLTEERYELIL